MKNDEWLTPPEILEALGPFDLDPCAPVNRPWPMASRHYTIQDDGLMKPWEGRIWLNPPYGLQAERWLRRLAEHANGIALIFARTETEAFFSQVWKRATGLLFIRGRLTFYRADGTKAKANGGAPSVLIAYGAENARRLEYSGINGAFLYLAEARA
jgi:hypothetical protein